MPQSKPKLVIALGGNAITTPSSSGTIEEQFRATDESMEFVAQLIENGYRQILITHGNGPQVGNAILRSELSSDVTYPLPIDICVADTQGGMGYMLQQVLTNSLIKRGIKNPVASIVTQVEVDSTDPAFKNPTKPVGKFYTEADSKELIKSKKWAMKEDAGRGWRRVVPSPTPKRIVEQKPIKDLIENGCVVIAGGGGGVPVAMANGAYRGMEAVVDKDLTSAILANDIGAEIFIILTSVESVYINFNSPKQKALGKVRIKEIESYLEKGEFKAGSMKPKVEACLNFLKGGGKEAIITSITKCLDALNGRSGTHIIP